MYSGKSSRTGALIGSSVGDNGASSICNGDVGTIINGSNGAGGGVEGGVSGGVSGSEGVGDLGGSSIKSSSSSAI